MRVFVSDHYEFPLPEGHRFPAAKYRLLRESLLAEAVLGPAELAPAPPADPGALTVAHDPAYIAAMASGTLDPRIQRAIGLPWSRALYLRSLASLGGSLAAARAALEDGIAGNLGGGTHHARRAAGAGFCVFNDLAVVALSLLAEGRIRKAAIVDLDVHQGDGNASLLGADPRIEILDMYCETNYPARKLTAGISVPLSEDTSDEQYLDLLERHLPRVLGVDLVLYLAGVDPLAADRLGRLSLSRAALALRDELVLSACRARGVPVSMVLGGGYADPITETVAAYAETYRAAKRVFG